MKVVICCPTIVKPYHCLLESLAGAVPLMDAKGWDHNLIWNIGGPYISYNRAFMMRKAIDARTDVVVFLDHDLSFSPESLIKLIESEGMLVAGTYRFKEEPEKYMGAIFSTPSGFPVVRESDGAISASCFPAGFMKITREGIARFMLAFPELQYIDEGTLNVDLFNHGVYKGVWYGEDYALCRNWLERIGDIWIIPDLNINHHTEEICYKGNFHQYLLRQPGGSEYHE